LFQQGIDEQQNKRFEVYALEAQKHRAALERWGISVAIVGAIMLVTALLFLQIV
jgi:CHASE3 domain sensor protein